MSLTAYLATLALGVIPFPAHRMRRGALPTRVEPILELRAEPVPEPELVRPRIPLKPHLHDRAPPGRSPHQRVAAKQFVEWLQEMGCTGEISWREDQTARRYWHRQGLWRLYLWHCDDMNIVPLQTNMLGEALGRQCKSFQVRDHTTGKLRRLTFYRIPGSPEASVSAVAGRQPKRQQKRAA